MRKTVVVMAVLAFGLSFAVAEPLMLEQAGTVNEKGMLEMGLGDISYQTDLVTLLNPAGIEVSKLTNTSTVFSLYSRYAFSEKIECTLNIPYLMLSSKQEPVGGAATTTDDAGLGDVQASAKYSFDQCGRCGWLTAAGLALSLPTGKQSTKFPESFRNGLNMKPSFMASKGLGKYSANINLSYEITAEYEDASDFKTKQDPGDVLSAGVGLEYPKSERTSFIGEFVYKSLSESKSAGAAVSGSSGSQMDLVCGLRHNRAGLKTKIGLVLALGDEKYRTYDYKIIAGLTYLWKI